MKHGWLLVALTVVGMCGCQSGPATTKDEDLPTLEEVRSRAAKPPPREPAQPQQPLTRDMQRVVVHRFDLPLQAALEPAWSLVDARPIDAETLRAWEVNGLRAGVIDRTEWPKFVRALPGVMASGAQQFTTAGDPVALPAAPAFREAIDIRLALPPIDRDDPQAHMQWVRLRPGRCQLLVYPERDVFGSILLRPHHHYSELTIQVRSPQEKALDGRIFNELPLRVFVPSDKMLIVALAPQPEKDQTFRLSAPASAVEPRPDPDATLEPMNPDHPGDSRSENSPPAPIPPALDPTPMPRDLLGSTILAARRGAKAVQIVLAIESPR